MPVAVVVVVETPDPTAVTKRRRRGTGTLTEQTPGVWRIVVSTHTGRVTRSMRGTHTDAENALVLLIVEKPGPGRRTVDLIDGHLELLHRAGRAAGTLRRYREIWDRWLAPRLANVKIDDITTPLLQSVVDAMADQGQSTGSINQALSLLSDAIKLAVRYGHIDFDANPSTGIQYPNGRNRAPGRNRLR